MCVCLSVYARPSCLYLGQTRMKEWDYNRDDTGIPWGRDLSEEQGSYLTVPLSAAEATG